MLAEEYREDTVSACIPVGSRVMSPWHHRTIRQYTLAVMQGFVRYLNLRWRL